MSLKCSLFGHSFGEPEVERERAEEGSEVVTTIREVAVCRRCGQTRVVSENTEVTTLESPESDETAGPSGDAGSAQSVHETTSPAAVDEPDEPAEAHPADPVAQVDPEPEQGQDAAPTEADDGVILDESDEESTEGDRKHGQWPEESEGDEPEWVSESTPSPAERDGTQGARIDGTGSALTVPEGEFRCPECGFSTPVESSSLRAGDFCPDCHRGALEHHSGQE